MDDMDFNDDNSNRLFLDYRTSLFNIIFFRIMKKRVHLLKNNLLVDTDTIKNTLVLFNNLVSDINANLVDLEFEQFSLESTKPENITISVKKSPFTDIVQMIKNPSRILLNEEDNICKPLYGLVTFIVYHKTKTKTELSINVISNTMTIKKQNQLKDITDIIDNKNPFLLRELESIITHNLKEKLKKKYLSVLTNDRTFEECESDLYYGFIGTITLNKDDVEDLNDVLDMLYYLDKPYIPYIKLYYTVYQYKKDTKHYIYTDVNNLPFDKYTNIIKAKAFVFEKEYIKKYLDRPIFFLSKSPQKNIMSLKIYNKFYGVIQPNQKYLYNLDDKLQIPIIIEALNQKCVCYFFSKDILYNNIYVDKKIVIYNKNKIFPSYILYDKKIIKNNTIFNIIKKYYIMANNEVLWFKENQTKNIGLYTLFKINPTNIPWGKIILFLKKKNKFLIQEFIEPLDIYNLIQEFKEEDPLTAKIIIDTLLYRSLSLTFQDLYENYDDMYDDSKTSSFSIQTFQEFYEKHYFINSDCYLEKIKSSDQEKLYKDFIFIFKIILLFIKHA
ncbi:hypothetical protein Yalta_070 [Yalta virus]|nr:hypothetical protein Yalta_070 [Yalta virus]